MVPRKAKFVLLTFIFVLVVILLINFGVPNPTWQNERVDNAIRKLKNKAKHIIPEAISSVFRKDDQRKIFSRRYDRDATAEEVLTLKMLIKDPTACFKMYELKEFENEPNDLLVSLEASVAQNKLSLFDMLSMFQEILSSLGVKTTILEPSIIHCMLKTRYTTLLAKRKFNIDNFKKSSNIITYGIIGDYIKILRKKENIHKLRNVGFQPYFVQEVIAPWMMKNSTRLESKKYTSHVFYSYYEWTIHIVVFQKRNSYLWHAELNSNDVLNIPKKDDLLFVQYDSAYENFSFVPLDIVWPTLADFYIPSSPHYFLFQIPISRFLECNLTRAENVINTTDSPKAHSSLSVEEFNNRTLISLGELKKFFNPLLMHFWIWSGTMLGWYRQCDVIPYTTDVDFGAWASEIQDLDFIIKHFKKNKQLKILERMGVQEEALEFQLRCDGLRVDVFFMYKIHNGSWASGHRPSLGYYFRYHYPPFTLCSADLMQQKVQVPCETEKVIVTEYGPEWMTPVSSWNYESSIHNRGPDIYWDNKTLPKVFAEY